MNFGNDDGTPAIPPPSSIEYSSPNRSRPKLSSQQSSITGSGGSSSSSNRTPLRKLELPPRLKVEEDVIVMDSVTVNSDSGSKYSGSGGAIYGILYKTVLCNSWKDTGGLYCRYGHMCQFAHGQGELRTTTNRLLRNLNNLQMNTSSQHSPSSAFSQRGSEATPSRAPASTLPLLSKTTTPAAVSPVPPLSYPDWNPMDDGIPVTSSDSTAEPPTRSAVDEHINNVLYGPPRRRRLQVFRDICPE